MVKLDLIEFADLIRSEDITDKIIKQNPNIKTPIPLEEIATAAGIVEIQYKPLDGLEGALVADEYKKNGVILINNNSSENKSRRQKFTLGHELGHFMMPLHGHMMNCSIDDMRTRNKYSQRKIIELQANEFSSQILMPKKIFTANKYNNREPSILNISKLMDEFDISFEACANRYISLHNKALAIIFYKDKKFKYFKTSQRMPFYFSQKQGKGLLAPQGSLGRKIKNHTQDKLYEGHVDSSIWFKEDNQYILPEKVIEQVYIQRNGFSVVMLKFENKLEKK